MLKYKDLGKSKEIVLFYNYNKIFLPTISIIAFYRFSTNTLKIVLLKSSKKYFYPFSLINESCTSPKKNFIGFKKALKCNS